MYQFFRARLALVLVAILLVASGSTGVQASEDVIYEEKMEQGEATDWTPTSYVSDQVTFWIPRAGDRFEVDIESNIGRLIHEDGEAVEFEVVTGVRRVVRYAGRRYLAITPVANWVVRETVIKGDRWTFGKTGRFIRMYKNGVTYTPYGIHPFGREDAMFRVSGRYGSMGCIILREAMIDVIQETIRVNGGEMNVRTFGEVSQI